MYVGLISLLIALKNELIRICKLLNIENFSCLHHKFAQIFSKFVDALAAGKTNISFLAYPNFVSDRQIDLAVYNIVVLF